MHGGNPAHDLSVRRALSRQPFMDKLVGPELQATLRALQLVGSAIECDADGCHGDAKGELIQLIHNLRSGEAKFRFSDSAQIADQAQAALDAHDTRQRKGRMSSLHIALWRRITDFLDS